LQQTERERCRPPERVTIPVKAMLAHSVSPCRHLRRIVAIIQQRQRVAVPVSRLTEDILKQRRLDSGRDLLSEVRR
jgi:hypothetical protein